MSNVRSLLVLASMLALAACKPATPPQPSTPPTDAATATAPSATVPGTDATSAVDQAPAAEITDKAGVVIDSKALAGDFEGSNSKLVIEADGGYTQALNAGGTELSSSGTWSAAGPGVLLLDPTDKAAQDVRFDVVSADELRSQDGAYTFKRTR